MFLANSITPYEYGIITLVAISIPGFIQIFTTLNFVQILSHSEEGSQYFGFSLISSLVSVVIISLVLFIFREPIFSYLNLPAENTNLFYFTILISILCISIIIDFQGLFTGLKLYSIPGIVLALPSLFRLFVIIILMLINWVPLEIILFIFAISNAIPLVIILLMKNYRKYLHNIFSIKIPGRDIFLFGAALFILSSFSTIGSSIIKIVISHELGVEWQGYFDVSMTLGTIAIFSLSTIGFISLAEATNANKAELSKKGGLYDVTRLLFAITIFAIVILYYYSDFIVTLLFSDQYLISANYVVILTIGYLFFFLQIYMANVYLATRTAVKEYLIFLFIPLAILPLFYYYTQFCMEYFKSVGIGNGFIGAYISFATLSFLLFAITVYLSKDKTSINNILVKYPRLAIAILAIILLNSIFPLEPFIGICISSIFFLLMILLFEYIDKEIIFDIFRKSE